MANSSLESYQVMILPQHVYANACFHHYTYPMCLESGATFTFLDRVDPMVE